MPIHYGFLFLLELTAAYLVYDREQTCVGVCSQPTYLLGLLADGTLVLSYFWMLRILFRCREDMLF